MKLRRVPWLRRILGCRFGGHERSKSRARVIDGRKVSVCRYCGTVMYKNRAGRWQTQEP
ncbi:MAG: hypothetical protein N2423_10155 [Novosphingobium sp.]|nr:hypothetical protein [Novosphingobium sp.]